MRTEKVVEDDSVSVRNEDEFIAQHNARSHEKFFSAENKQKLRRKELLERQMVEMVTGLADHPKGPQFRTISDESFTKLMTGGEEVWKSEHFTPVAKYAVKVMKLRPLYKGEVGIVERPGQPAFFLVLEEGFGRSFKGMEASTTVAESSPIPAAVEPPESRLFKVTGSTRTVLTFAVSEEDAIMDTAPELGGGEVSAIRVGSFDQCAKDRHNIRVGVDGEKRGMLSCATCGMTEEGK